jgi:hypothetical protein
MPVRAPTRASSLKRRTTVDVAPLPGKRSGSVTPHSTTSERPSSKSHSNPTFPKLAGLVTGTGRPTGLHTGTYARVSGPGLGASSNPTRKPNTTLPTSDTTGKPCISLPSNSTPPTPKATPNKTSGSLTPKSATSDLLYLPKSPRSPKPASQISRPGTPTSPSLKKPAWGARPVDPMVAARVAARSPTPRSRAEGPQAEGQSPKGSGAQNVGAFRLPSRAASFKDANMPCGGLDALVRAEHVPYFCGYDKDRHVWGGVSGGGEL